MAITIQDGLKKGMALMKDTDIQTPLLDAEVILCHILKMDRLFLHVRKNEMLKEEDLEIFLKLIEKRIQGVPVQYIIGHQEFMSLPFYVEQGVLIPRPDTEILVEFIINWTENSHNKAIKIADIGVGSGAISVSLAKYIKESFVYGVDISKKALTIAQKNATINEVEERIMFLEGDLLDPLHNKNLIEQLDVLVSNPPYIPKKVIDTLQIEVKNYEPILALDGGEDGLDFYKKIIKEGSKFLKKGGLLALEVGHDQAKEVENLIQNEGVYKNIQKIKDLAGIERVVVATL